MSFNDIDKTDNIFEQGGGVDILGSVRTAYTEFNFEDVYKKIWGYTFLPYPAGNLKKAFTPQNPLAPAKAFGNQFKKTRLGVPIQMPMKIEELPILMVTVSIEGRQKIVKKYTHHPKIRGSIKEQWGLDDYQIKIRGIFLPQEQQTEDQEGFSEEMKQKITTLRKIYEKGMVKVESPIFQQFGIVNMVVEQLRFPFDKGLQVVPWELNGVSDFMSENILENEATQLEKEKKTETEK